MSGPQVVTSCDCLTIVYMYNTTQMFLAGLVSFFPTVCLTHLVNDGCGTDLMKEETLTSRAEEIINAFTTIGDRTHICFRSGQKYKSKKALADMLIQTITILKKRAVFPPFQTQFNHSTQRKISKEIENATIMQIHHNLISGPDLPRIVSYLLIWKDLKTLPVHVI